MTKLEKLKRQVEELEKEIKLKPIKQTIPGQKLEWGKLAEEDMPWEKAKEWCKSQGKGWRLPTAIELLHAHDGKIPGFSTGYHWSGTEYSVTNARGVYFSDGSVNTYSKTYSYSVRSVRGW